MPAPVPQPPHPPAPCERWRHRRGTRQPRPRSAAVPPRARRLPRRITACRHPREPRRGEQRLRVLDAPEPRERCPSPRVHSDTSSRSFASADVARSGSAPGGSMPCGSMTAFSTCATTRPVDRATEPSARIPVPASRPGSPSRSRPSCRCGCATSISPTTAARIRSNTNRMPTTSRGSRPTSVGSSS